MWTRILCYSSFNYSPDGLLLALKPYNIEKLMFDLFRGSVRKQCSVYHVEGTCYVYILDNLQLVRVFSQKKNVKIPKL